MSAEPVTINLVPADDYRRTNYGVLLVSETQHDFAGRVHNPHHRHSLEVWENRRGLDPFGQPTTDPYRYLWSPHANVISAHPAMRDNPTMGETLRLGDVVRLAVHGLVLGDFRIAARSLHDPHLEPVAVSN